MNWAKLISKLDLDQFETEGNYTKMVFKSMGYYDTKARSIIVKMRAVLAHNLRLELAFE